MSNPRPRLSVAAQLVGKMKEHSERSISRLSSRNLKDFIIFLESVHTQVVMDYEHVQDMQTLLRQQGKSEVLLELNEVLMAELAKRAKQSSPEEEVTDE